MTQFEFLLVLVGIYVVTFLIISRFPRLKKHRKDPNWWIAFYVMLACIVSIITTVYDIFISEEEYHFYLNLYITIPVTIFLMTVSVLIWKHGLKANWKEGEGKAESDVSQDTETKT
ncbi:MAG: hypothetical protein AAGB46_19685 [Verrucomicrobiota bacterium]